MHRLASSTISAVVDPDDCDNNPSANTSLDQVMAARLDRRPLLRLGIGALAAAGLCGSGLSDCGGGSGSGRLTAVPAPSAALAAPVLSFSAVRRDLADRVVAPV